VQSSILISPSRFPARAGDGAYYTELTLALRRKSIRCILVCPKNPDSEDFDHGLAALGIRVVRIPVSPPRLTDTRNWGRAQFVALKLLIFYIAEVVTMWRLRPRSATLCFYRHSILTLPLGILAKRLNLRMVADGEAISQSTENPFRPPKLLIAVLRLAERLAFQNFSFYRISGVEQLSSIKGMGDISTRAIVSGAGVSVPHVPKYELADIPRATFGFFGAIEKWQGLDFLLRSFSLVTREEPSAQLFVIGDGSVKGELQSLADQLKIDRNVIFMPSKPRDSFWLEDLKRFRVVVIPRPELSVPVSPIKLAEGLASGKPVIATDIRGIREHAGPGVVLVRSGDAQGFADAMLRFCREESLLLKMGREAENTAAQFDIDIQVQRLLDRM
jgi:glycosyltransferase involved in cell wall biosynthesis